MSITYEYGYEIIEHDGSFAVLHNGEACTEGAFCKPVVRKSVKTAENYVHKMVMQVAAYNALGEEGRARLRTEREAREAAEKAERDRAYDERLRREREAKEGRRERAATNSFLRDRGYRWRDLGLKNEEDADFTDFTQVTYGHDWQLFSPDDRPVSVNEAMQELAWQGVAFAKDWLASRAIAEEAPAIAKHIPGGKQ